jgi:hypothetical protein
LSLKDGITLAIALVGAVLGIINTVHSLSRSRVRLRVVPKTAKAMGDQAMLTNSTQAISNHLCIDVVNLSAFAVTISSVGFKVRGTSGFASVWQPIVFDGKPWPRRLEPRESVTAYLAPGQDLTRASRAYAKTDCGELRYGSSRALKEYVKSRHARDRR